MSGYALTHAAKDGLTFYLENQSINQSIGHGWESSNFLLISPNCQDSDNVKLFPILTLRTLVDASVGQKYSSACIGKM